MFFRAVISACAFMLLPAVASADPTGTFKVTGVGETGNRYEGTVRFFARAKPTWSTG